MCVQIFRSGDGGDTCPRSYFFRPLSLSDDVGISPTPLKVIYLKLMMQAASSQLLKILYVEPVTDPIQKIAELELGCRSYFEAFIPRIITDFTVVRDCVSAFEQIDIVNFDIIIVNQSVKTVSGVEMLNVLRQYGFSTPVIFMTFTDPVTPETQSLAISMGYFNVISNASGFQDISRVIFEAYTFSDTDRHLATPPPLTLPDEVNGQLSNDVLTKIAIHEI